MFLLAAAVAAGPALAAEPVPSVRLTFTVDGAPLAQDAPSVVAVVASSERPVVVTTGARVPIPTSATSTDGSADDGGVRFSYQNVGLSIRADVRAVGDGLRVAGTIEASGLAPGSAPPGLGSPPVVVASSSGFDVTLKDGGSERIVRVGGPDGDRLVVDLRLDLLD